MKTYFCKYLPVEGEVEENDVAVHLDGDVSKMDKHFIKETRSSGELSSIRKVKLFLCSKNIQIGDKIKYLNRNEDMMFEGTLDKINEGYICLVEDKFEDDYHMSYFLKHAFKVIGEISPEAEWVKESDEFDEGDLGTLLNGEVVAFNHWLPNAIPKIVSIKGPCGHFH